MRWVDLLPRLAKGHGGHRKDSDRSGELQLITAIIRGLLYHPDPRMIPSLQIEPWFLTSYNCLPVWNMEGARETVKVQKGSQ